MANNSDYYRAQLEAQARGREHAQHIEEYARMCKMMIEESVPILIEQYMAHKKHSVAFDVKTDLNGKFSGGCQDKGDGLQGCSLGELHYGQAVCRRLAGACLCQGNKVALPSVLVSIA